MTIIIGVKKPPFLLFNNFFMRDSFLSFTISLDVYDYANQQRRGTCITHKIILARKMIAGGIAFNVVSRLVFILHFGRAATAPFSICFTSIL